MRERLAKAFAVALVLLVTGLAALFAERQNAPARMGEGTTSETRVAPRVSAQGVRPLASAVGRGRDAFVALGCLRCHRVAGEGSPRSVLDHVGDRLFPDEIRAWIVADPSVLSELSKTAVRAKSEYRDLSDETIGDLVAYLSSLRRGL